MPEEKIIREFLKGNDEVLEEKDIDIVELHEADKHRNASKRKQNAKHKGKSKPVDPLFFDRTATEKKTFKKASVKKSRRASEMVNSSRALYKKVHTDLDDRLR